MPAVLLGGVFEGVSLEAQLESLIVRAGTLVQHVVETLLVGVGAMRRKLKLDGRFVLLEEGGVGRSDPFGHFRKEKEKVNLFHHSFTILP